MMYIKRFFKLEIFVKIICMLKLNKLVWHKMQPGKELSQVQQDYLVDVIMTWIQKEIEGQEHKI